MPFFKATNDLDRVFEISILLKALDGFLEMLGGALLLLIRPDNITHFAKWLTQHELSQDPHDFIATHILHSAQSLAAGGTAFAAFYLFSHGITKIILVIEILREHLWAYKGLMIFLVIFIVYQIYRIVEKPTISMTLLTIFDAFILALTVREDKRQRQLFAAKTAND